LAGQPNAIPGKVLELSGRRRHRPPPSQRSVRLENATLCVKFHERCKRTRALRLSQGGTP
jgi:hypothetical protein